MGAAGIGAELWLLEGSRCWGCRVSAAVHLVVDTATGDIRAVNFTLCGEGDSPLLPDLSNLIPAVEPIGTVTGDETFDSSRSHVDPPDRGGAAVMPIRRSGRIPN